MREHALNPQPRRRFIATTDSDHNDPICLAITTSFVYVPVILDAWSRRVVGYAISRSIDARLAAAALKAAIRAPNHPRGCVHHSRVRRRHSGSSRKSAALVLWSREPITGGR